MGKYIMALDQGTTSSRTIIFDRKGRIIALAREEFAQIYPSPGWVEHDPMAILESQKRTMREAMRQAGASPDDIEAAGISNQRETTVVWDRFSGKPVYNAIVWQCRRTADICVKMKEKGLEEHVRRTTGLVIDAYFSATKIKWILDNVPGARAQAEEGRLIFGTIDTWLVWNLTRGAVHATDYSNASRTMLYDIRDLRWDDRLLEELDIPKSMLPEVRESSGDFGSIELDGAAIPIRGVAGDQQAALFGQACFEPGSVKNTYGTGCFMLMNTGERAIESKSGLLTTIAWGVEGKVEYALEGSVFIGGAVIQWLRDEMQLIASAADSEACAASIPDSGGVYFVPAFVGLGAPYWNMECRGIIAGLTRGTGKNHIIRAALESIAYQVRSILETIEKDEGIWIRAFKADGGAAANNFLMQFQSDILNVAVERPAMIETTALGAAYLAGLSTGYWSGREDIIGNHMIDRTFRPQMQEKERAALWNGWGNAIRKATNFNGFER